MTDVFISYSRLDKDFVGQLREALIAKAQDVWIDWESIPPSQAWWNEIQKGIARANNFVVILSPASMASPICQMEIEYARQLKKRIIPVIHADFVREEALISITKRLATKEESTTREIWGTRQPHDVFDGNDGELKHINYFFFKADADFPKRFDELFTIIRTDYAYKEQHTTLELRAQEWDRRGRDTGFLLIENELLDAQAWISRSVNKEPAPTELHRAYIGASEKRTRQLRNIQRAAWVASAATVLAIVFAIGASVIGTKAVNKAQAQLSTATIEQGIAQESAFEASTKVAVASTAQHESEQSAVQANTQVAQAQGTATQIPPTLTQAAVLQEKVQSKFRAAQEFSNAILTNNNVPSLIINDLTEYLKQYPDEPSAYIYRSAMYSNEKQYEAAITDLTHAIELDPQSNTYDSRGSNYFLMGELDLAFADFNTAIDLDPKNASVYVSRGNVYLRQNEIDLALKDYNTALEINPKNVRGLYRRGDFYSRLGQWDLAFADYNAAIEIDPQDEVIYVSRGSAYAKQGKVDLAIADYTKVITLNPKNIDGYVDRGGIYANQEKYDLAIQDLNVAIVLDPNNPTLYYLRGGANYFTSQFNLSISDYNRVVELNPHYADVYRMRGDTYKAQGKLDLALADYTTAIQQNPQDGEAFRKRGTIYYDQDKLDVALSDFTDAIRLNSASAYTYTLRSKV